MELTDKEKEEGWVIGSAGSRKYRDGVIWHGQQPYSSFKDAVEQCEGVGEYNAEADETK